MMAGLLKRNAFLPNGKGLEKHFLIMAGRKGRGFGLKAAVRGRNRLLIEIRELFNCSF
jgi:hypothetical protein